MKLYAELKTPIHLSLRLGDGSHHYPRVLNDFTFYFLVPRHQNIRRGFLAFRTLNDFVVTLPATIREDAEKVIVAIDDEMTEDCCVVRWSEFDEDFKFGPDDQFLVPRDIIDHLVIDLPEVFTRKVSMYGRWTPGQGLHFEFKDHLVCRIGRVKVRESIFKQRATK